MIDKILEDLKAENKALIKANKSLAERTSSGWVRRLTGCWINCLRWKSYITYHELFAPLRETKKG